MQEPALTRRDFLKAAATASAAAAAFSPQDNPLTTFAEATEFSTRTTSFEIIPGRCHECHAQCGMLVHVRDGRVLKVEGDPRAPNRGALCAKGLTTVRNLYSPERLNYPMKRTRPKGDPDPGWVRITWDEALATIVAKLNEIRAKYGAYAIAFGQGTGRYSEPHSLRLKNSVGTPNWIAPGHICYAPMGATTGLTIGHYAHADYVHTACQVHWGSNPVWAHAAMSGRPIMDNLLVRRSRLIVIDPRFEHPLAHKADIFLPVRPGSDGALAMSWIRVILSERLFDQAFVSRWTNAPFLVRTDTMRLLRQAEATAGGDSRDFILYPDSIADRHNRPTLMVWDPVSKSAKPADTPGVEPALFGTCVVNGIECKPVLQLLAERAAKYDPKNAAETCGTGSAEKIRQAARTYATSSSAAMEIGGQGVEGGHSNSFQTLRALVILAALTGNINRPGGNVGIPHWSWIAGQWRREGGPRAMVPWGAPADHFAIVMEGPFPTEAPLHTHPLQPGQPSMIGCFRAMKSGAPYPIKAYIMVQGNPLGGWCEDQQTVYEGLKNLEFLVDMDLYITPTNNLADIVLPAGLGPFERGEHKSLGPAYERWPDEKFYLELGHRLNPEWWPWHSEDEWRSWRRRIEFEDAEGAKAAGIAVEHGQPEPPLYYYNLLDKQTGKPIGFPTPTGKIEIFSVIAQQNGFDPLPDYAEPADSPYSKPDLAREYPLVLTTGARLPVFYHSEHRNNPLQRELFPDPEVEINDEGAAKLGIGRGDWVWIETRNGRIRMKARLTPAIAPGVVSMAHGWWQGCRELGLPGYGWNGSNANVLIPGDAHDAALGIPAVRSQLCRIYKAEAPPQSWDPPYYGSTQPQQHGERGNDAAKPARKEV